MAVSALRDERGQMTVELCIVFPVVIIIAVIAVNALLFFSECAALDRASRIAACVLAASPSSKEEPTALAARISSAVSTEMEMDVECEALGSEGGLHRFRVTCAFQPTLFGMGLRSEVWGVPLPKLMHSTELTLDVYSSRKQVLMDG